MSLGASPLAIFETFLIVEVFAAAYLSGEVALDVLDISDVLIFSWVPDRTAILQFAPNHRLVQFQHKKRRACAECTQDPSSHFPS